MPRFAINYPTGKPGAAIAAQTAGYALREETPGSWVVYADDQTKATACQTFLTGFDDVARARNEAKARIEQEVANRLDAAFSTATLIAGLIRRIEILEKQTGTGTITSLTKLVTADQTERTSYQAMFDKIKAIRTYGNTLSTQVSSMTVDQADAFVPSVQTGWPA